LAGEACATEDDAKMMATAARLQSVVTTRWLMSWVETQDARLEDTRGRFQEGRQRENEPQMDSDGRGFVRRHEVFGSVQSTIQDGKMGNAQNARKVRVLCKPFNSLIG
jgi:hypothetical protein